MKSTGPTIISPGSKTRCSFLEDAESSWRLVLYDVLFSAPHSLRNHSQDKIQPVADPTLAAFQKFLLQRSSQMCGIATSLKAFLGGWLDDLAPTTSPPWGYDQPHLTLPSLGQHFAFDRGLGTRCHRWGAPTRSSS